MSRRSSSLPYLSSRPIPPRTCALHSLKSSACAFCGVRSSMCDVLIAVPGSELKTVSAWFQNKRASCKKRNNKAANNTPANNHFELPPISQLIASVSPNEYDDSEDDHPFSDRLPPISSSASTSSQQRSQRSRPLFYTGTTQHQHLFDTDMNAQRKGRSRPTAAQTEELRKLYDETQHPTKDQREELGHRIGM